MTVKKKDNPAALGVMAVILLAAMVSIGRSLFSGNAPAAVRVAATAATQDSELPRASSGALPISERDPFSSPLLKMQKAVRPVAGNSLRGPSVMPAVPVTLMPIVPVRRASVSSPGSGLPHAQPAVPVSQRDGALPAGVNVPSGREPVEDEALLTRSLRVTAIVMGAHPYAVLEPMGNSPRTLHVGETYHTLRMVEVRAREIVLNGRSGLWTLLLGTTDTDNPLPTIQK
jgi:hypothetical protein